VYWRDADTVAIAGHRTTYRKPFANLPQVRRGDTIVVGGRRYVVRRTVVVKPTEIWVLRQRGLVLSTCHPAGSAATRFVVLAAPIR
jgi:sortase A